MVEILSLLIEVAMIAREKAVKQKVSPASPSSEAHWMWAPIDSIYMYAVQRQMHIALIY